MTTPCYPSHTIKAEARRLGFFACGVAPAGKLPEAHAAWRERSLRLGHHADMQWLAAHEALRRDVCALVEGARCVVSVALPYYTEPHQAHIARYAQGRDYHVVMRRRLLHLAQAIGALSPEVSIGRRTPSRGAWGAAFVDTAPIDERYWAWRCGVGFIGRHTQLIVPGAGTYCFLGELVLTAPADIYDTPLPLHCPPHCGRCTAACPMGALDATGLDARRCLSYLTIEHKGALPAAAQRAMRESGTCYGCDACAEACPYNARVQATTEADLQPTTALLQRDNWQSMTQEEYAALFAHSAVRRAGYTGLLRNMAAHSTEKEVAKKIDEEGVRQ